MRSFEDFDSWKRSHAVVLQVYSLTRSFPDNEKFGLTSQLRRAAVSIAANIAEGCKRGSRLDFAKFVVTARASAAEVEYLVLLSCELGFIERSVALELREELDHIQRMLTALWKSLNVAR